MTKTKKKVTMLAALAFAACHVTQAQVPGSWNTELNTFLPTEVPGFGTMSNHPIKFFTQGIDRMTLTTDGDLELNGAIKSPKLLFDNDYGITKGSYTDGTNTN